MKFKLISSIIIFDIVLIALIGYMLVQHEKTEGGIMVREYQDAYLYGVMLDDGGESGEAIGCGDSLVPVVHYTSEEFSKVNEGLIVEALRGLLSLTNDGMDEFGNGLLYTAAYQPNLLVDGIEQNGNTANVFLRGSIKLGGVCDTPRFQKQLERTATQFDGVDFARFYLNGSEENFHKALNGK